MEITPTIKYVGVDDLDIDLFESQYVVPEGMAYNSYVILDEKVAIMDTVDARKAAEWWAMLRLHLQVAPPITLLCSILNPTMPRSSMRCSTGIPVQRWWQRQRLCR